MRYALFLGCTVPIRNMNYELSARKVAAKLGIEFADSDDFACCGFPLKGMDQHTALLMAARNLAVAEAKGLDICALCTACSVTLTEANKQLTEDADLRAKINNELKATGGKEYQGTIKVRHIARALYEGVGVAGLQSAVKTKLSGFRFAAQYGCHYMKPSEVFDGFEDAENPKTLDALIQATGAEAVDYASKLQCCGGGILAADEQIALAMPYAKLVELNKPAVFHTGYLAPLYRWSGESPEHPVWTEHMRPMQVEVVARRFPKLQIVMAHYGNPWFEEGWKVSWTKENVYGDLCGGTAIHRSIRFWADLFAPDGELFEESIVKLCFGSDMHVRRADDFTVDQYIRFYNRIYDAIGLSPELRELVNRGNTARIFGLK